jgi:hypothetical protein
MLNFPDRPVTGQRWPQPAVVGLPIYLWDGEKWTTSQTRASTTDPASNDTPRMDAIAAAGVTRKYARADHRHPGDATKAVPFNSSFTGTLTAGPIDVARDVKVDGAITSSAKQHRFGQANGRSATAGVLPDDANILLYDRGNNNWSGIGADGDGNFWIRAGLSGTPAPAMRIGVDQVAHFTNPPTAPTPGAGDSSTKLATTAFVKSRVVGGNFYPLNGSATVNGYLTIANAALWVHNNANYGVLYLGNTGSYYLQWDGSNYNLPNAALNASNGRLWGNNDFGFPYNNARLAYIADYNHAGGNSSVEEPYGGCVITGESGPPGMGGSWTRRYRQMQYYTNGWFAIGYA